MSDDVPMSYARDRAPTLSRELVEGAEPGAVADTLAVRARMVADERRPFLTLMVVACVVQKGFYPTSLDPDVTRK